VALEGRFEVSQLACVVLVTGHSGKMPNTPSIPSAACMKFSRLKMLDSSRFASRMLLIWIGHDPVAGKDVFMAIPEMFVVPKTYEQLLMDVAVFGVRLRDTLPDGGKRDPARQASLGLFDACPSTPAQVSAFGITIKLQDCVVSSIRVKLTPPDSIGMAMLWSSGGSP
jgi:hypothetical protein